MTKDAIILASDVRMIERDGAVWCNHPAASYEAWRAYRGTGLPVSVLARRDDSLQDATVRVDGPGVTVVFLPSYSGVLGLLLGAPRVFRGMTAGGRQSLFVGRLPEPLSVLLFIRSRLLRASFVSLVVSEPSQLFRAHFQGFTGRILGAVARWTTRRIVRRSDGVVYVSQAWLQRLYPAQRGVPTLGRSNALLPDSAFRKRQWDAEKIDTVKLVTIASLTGSAKGVPTLFATMRSLSDLGVSAALTVVGGGQDLERVRGEARESGIDDSVHFTGQISDVETLRSVLDDAHIYVSASKAEGLPRATLEAMARSLPVVSTNAGAVCELINDRYIVPIEDARSIAHGVAALVADGAERRSTGEANYETALRLREAARPELLTEFLKSLGES